MDKKEFVHKCGELLTIAKPNLVSCEYRLGRDMPQSPFKKFFHNEEYVLVTCENGYTYDIHISGNSLNAIAEAIFSAMACK